MAFSMPPSINAYDRAQDDLTNSRLYDAWTEALASIPWSWTVTYSVPRFRSETRPESRSSCTPAGRIQLLRVWRRLVRWLGRPVAQHALWVIGVEYSSGGVAHGHGLLFDRRGLTQTPDEAERYLSRRFGSDAQIEPWRPGCGALSYALKSVRYGADPLFSANLFEARPDR